MCFSHYFFRQPNHEPVRIHVVNLFRYKPQQKKAMIRTAALLNNWYGAEIVQFEKPSCACSTWAFRLLYDKLRVQRASA